MLHQRLSPHDGHDDAGIMMPSSLFAFAPWRESNPRFPLALRRRNFLMPSRKGAKSVLP